MLGALLAGPIANTAGRKLAIATAAVPWIVAWLGIGFGSSFGVILAARVLSGVAVGIASMTVPLYIAETAPASLRGALGAVNQLAVTVGIFFVYLLGYLAQATQPTIFTAAEMACPSQMYNHTAGGVCETELAPWRVLALVGAAVAVVLLLSALLVLPETPPFLASKGRAAAARRVLGRLRTSDAEAAEELEAMLRTQAPSPSPSASTDGAATHDEMGGRPVEEMGDFAADTPPAAPRKEGGLRGLLAPGARWPLAIGCLLMVTQQFSGINAARLALDLSLSPYTRTHSHPSAFSPYTSPLTPHPSPLHHPPPPPPPPPRPPPPRWSSTRHPSCAAAASTTLIREASSSWPCRSS